MEQRADPSICSLLLAESGRRTSVVPSKRRPRPVGRSLPIPARSKLRAEKRHRASPIQGGIIGREFAFGVGAVEGAVGQGEVGWVRAWPVPGGNTDHRRRCRAPRRDTPGLRRPQRSTPQRVAGSAQRVRPLSRLGEHHKGTDTLGAPATAPWVRSPAKGFSRGGAEARRGRASTKGRAV